MPSWNDVSTWNSGSRGKPRFSVSFRDPSALDGGVSTETTSAGAPLLPSHVLEAARVASPSMRIVAEEAGGLMHRREADSGEGPGPAVRAVPSSGAVENTGSHAVPDRTASADAHATPAGAQATDIALLCRSIDVLTDAVRRLDQHLDRLLEVHAHSTRAADCAGHGDEDDGVPPPLSSEVTRDDRSTLERDLHSVLAEIAQVRFEGAPHAELARLRRRQADVIARLLALDNRDDVAINLRLVAAESGPALRRRLG